MSLTQKLEANLVSDLVAANLPELAAFDIESFAGQVNLANDQVLIGKPSILIAVVGATRLASVRGGDTLRVAYVAVSPGTDQGVRRQDALDALFAIRDYLNTTDLLFEEIRTEALHPVTIATLYAQFVG